MFILKDNESLAENDNNNKKDQITIAKIQAQKQYSRTWKIANRIDHTNLF